MSLNYVKVTLQVVSHTGVAKHVTKGIPYSVYVRHQKLFDSGLQTSQEIYNSILLEIDDAERKAEHFITFKTGIQEEPETWQVTLSMKRRFSAFDISKHGPRANMVNTFKANQIRQHSRKLTKTVISSMPEKSKLPQPDYDNETLAQGIFG